MPYSFEGKIRYSESGEDKKLTLFGVVNYFQDCATFHSESIGLGIDALKERHRAWLLSYWQIEIGRYPQLGDFVITSTWPYEFRLFLGMRNFTMKTPKGECLAWANSVWTYADMQKGIPAKLTREDLQGYETEEKLKMNYKPRKILLPSGMRKEEPFRIQKQHLDTNHHVNNGQHIALALAYLPEDFKIRQMRAEYKKQVFLDDLLTPMVLQEENRVLVSLEDEVGEPCSVVEFCRME